MINAHITNKELEMFVAEPVNNMAFVPNHEMAQSMARELLALRKEKLMLGIYHESKPRFYPRFNVVYMDDNKVCGYTLHTGRFSAFERKNFDKNFIKAGLPE
ncbi:hypothetical protein [Mixta calida]|uniref:hypothetical protein n=1 Tax=Mixta calida TaxID=665913 RepID=UPI00119CAAFC|nr:hypothetical protein [Mixta calida]DAV72786.1 MAG TPA: hypothetical protein [Caudoviricetes sp.]